MHFLARSMLASFHLDCLSFTFQFLFSITKIKIPQQYISLNKIILGGVKFEFTVQKGMFPMQELWNANKSGTSTCSSSLQVL